MNMTSNIMGPKETKVVNIYATRAIGELNPPIRGTVRRVTKSISEIRTCLIGRAMVEEVLSDGTIIKLNITNYNHRNIPASKKTEEVSEPVKTTVEEPVAVATEEPKDTIAPEQLSNRERRRRDREERRRKERLEREKEAAAATQTAEESKPEDNIAVIDIEEVL